MSREEDFLKRWSRRKREIAAAEKQTAPAAKNEAVDATAPDSEIASETPAPGRAEFDPATLPPIESINALSDVTAFLRADVPTELTRAALRRVWAADPAIRDFVGLAENSWDFTDPTAMPGFGPLESTEQVRRMIAQVIDQIGQAAKPAVPEAVTASASENANKSNAIMDDDKKNAVDARVPVDEPKQNDAGLLGSQALLQSSKEDIAPQHDVTQEQEKSRQFSHRNHGGALPE
jgi:hypothetical protein